MSEETAIVLKEAETKLLAVENEVEACKKAFLEAVAARIPQKVTEFGKKTALSQPDVTKALGAAGVKVMRGELEGLAARLAEDISGAGSSINWPQPSLYSALKFKDLGSALFEYMRPKMGQFAHVFKSKGYDVHDDNSRKSQGLVLPQWFYSEADLTEQTGLLLSALSQLAKAELALNKAKKAHDDSTVEDLWND